MRFCYSTLAKTVPAGSGSGQAGVAVTLDTLFAASDEIHRYCKLDESLLLWRRSQRVRVTSRGLVFLHFPMRSLLGLFTFSVRDADGVEIKDEVTMISTRLLQVPLRYCLQYLIVKALSGWGYEAGLIHVVSPKVPSPTLFDLPFDILKAQTPEIDGLGFVVRVDDEMMLVVDEDTDNWKLARGIGGTTAVEHSRYSVFYQLQAPPLLEDAAIGIARSLAVRKKEPARGVARHVTVPDGERLVRTDPLAAFRADLQTYVR